MKKIDITKARAIINVRGQDIPVDTNQCTANDIRRVAGIKQGRTILAEGEQGMFAMKENKMYTIPKRSKFKDSPSVRKPTM